jgi:penicillin-binding protein 2
MLGAAMTNYKVKPRLTYDKKIEQENMGFQSQSISEISKGLQAVLEKGGTASGSYVNVNGQTMGGKTGTSQVRRISLEERSEGIRADSDLPWDLRNHGLFVGYAPANKPKYVISVIAEHVGTSSPVAHVASDVMKDLLNAKF